MPNNLTLPRRITSFRRCVNMTLSFLNWRVIKASPHCRRNSQLGGGRGNMHQRRRTANVTRLLRSVQWSSTVTVPDAQIDAFAVSALQ